MDGLLRWPRVTGAQTRLLAEHQRLRVDEPEGINNDLPLDRLDRVNDHGDGSRRKLLEGLLRVDIDGRQPAAETRVRVVPSDDRLWPAPDMVSIKKHTTALQMVSEWGGGPTVPSGEAYPSSSFGIPGRLPRH